MYGSGIEQPGVDFSTLDYLQITPGSYFIGFDSGNLGKLSKIDSAGNITVLENSSISFQYEIGEYVASEGGVIAYRWLSSTANGSPTAGTVQNYLVVDTQDLPAVLWATSNANILNVESTWNGLTNTANIYDAGIEGGFGTPAATSCYNSSNNGKTDWYLPAIDELNKVWDNRWEIAQGLIAASGNQLGFNSYWSSTELDGDFAWYFDFFTGFTGTVDKSNNYFVRAVRQFSI
jgi:hypothetical protein